MCGFSERITSAAAGYKAPPFVSSFLSCQATTTQPQQTAGAGDGEKQLLVLFKGALVYDFTFLTLVCVAV